MGNVQSAAATERALTLFKPKFAFFVGVAGALRDDLAIGDVIIADKVYYYESGKAAAKFKTRPEAPLVSHETSQRAHAVVRDKAWQSRISPVPAHLPKALVKPIAAGEKIVASKISAEFKRLRDTYSDAHAVAMEEHGFCVSLNAHPKVCFAVIRGISDFIEGKEEADRAGSHDIAARNAAAFAFEMLAGLLRGRAKPVEEERPFID
jgi:nucleoside phosphorylase